MRYFWFPFILLCIAVIGIAGFRGEKSTKPPLEIFADNGKVEHVERILDELANAWVQWVGQILATVHAQDADSGGAKKQSPREFPHGRKHGQEVCAIRPRIAIAALVRGGQLEEPVRRPR